MTQPGSALDWGSVDEGARVRAFTHDLHNLLAVVITYAELARDSLPGDHAADADMAKIGHAATKAVALVKTLAALPMPHD